MDSGYQLKRQDNPRRNANWLSVVTFFFALGTLKKGAKKELEPEDIYDTLKEFQSKRLGDELEKGWNETLQRKKNWLLGTLFKIYGWEFMFYGIVLFLGESLPTFPVRLLRKGFRKSLDYEDIYEIVTDYKAGDLGDRIEQEWMMEKRKSRPNLIVPIFRLFGPHYWLLVLVNLFVNTPLTLLLPIVMGKAIAHFSPDSQTTRSDAIIYFLIFFVLLTLRTLYAHTYFLCLSQNSLRAKIALTSLIYRKSLQLNANAFVESQNGKIVTMLTKDVSALDLANLFSIEMMVGTVQIFLMIYVMYREIQMAAIFGVSIMFLLTPLQVCFGKLSCRFRLKTAAKTDMRVRVTQEVLTAIKIIKMYTWEPFFSKIADKLRMREIKNLRILFYIRAIALTIGGLSSRLALYVCVMAYVGFGNHITAEKAFIVTGCFHSLRSVFTVFMPLGIACLADLKASLKRITEFLLMEECEEVETCEANDGNPLIKTSNLCRKAENGNEIISNVTLDLEPGIVILTGPVGAGKSTLLKLLLMDVKRSGGSISVSGTISYASQEPWLFPGTIRQNILFGQEYNEKRYEKIVQICALQTDFQLLPFGDGTCLTDKGLNLSRGQKARINLARCVYKDADIYLMDDCLSAVDNAVGKHIFDECLRTHLRGKLIVFVSHQIRYLEQSDRVIVMNKGKIDFDGTYTKLKESHIDFKSALGNVDGVDNNIEMKNEKNINETEEGEEDELLVKPNLSPTRGIYDEVKETGKIKKEVYQEYFKAGGGFLMSSMLLILFILSQGSQSWSDYFVTFWVDMEQNLSTYRFQNLTNTSEYHNMEKSHSDIMKLYSGVILLATVLMLIKVFAYYLFCSKISVNLHRKMVTSILNAGMPFFDAHLSGNVLNRFSRDLGMIDELLPNILYEVLRVSVARSPVIGHINASLEGLTTIRASKAQNILKKEFDKHQDVYNSTYYMHLTTARAFGFYLDSMCIVYIAIIISSFFIFQTNTLAGKVGLAITQSFSLTGILQWGVRQWADFENTMTSVERVIECTHVEGEEKNGETVENWPKIGQIVYKNVDLCYPPSTERVLKSLSFVVESQEKVGVVGRTGAGKSSIISTLFNLYHFDGSILIDNVDITKVNLELLRSSISIIPQDPVLFSGSLRSNLDPHNEFSDKELWAALEDVEIKNILPTLDEEMSDCGTNFSIGQKQLLCLARAIIRHNKILILDEATANVDPQTDALIQRTIRQKFEHCTVLTIAHRLNTIMDCDKILVLDGGVLVEFDSPKNLIERKSGLFYSMAMKAGLV